MNQVVHFGQEQWMSMMAALGSVISALSESGPFNRTVCKTNVKWP